MTATTEGAAGLGVATALVRLGHRVQHVFADVSRDHGLTPQQLQLLCMLMTGPVGMTRLSRRLNLERSSVSGLVDRVEKRGLVVRTPDPDDRRAWRAALTGEGERLAVAAHGDVAARLDAAAAPLEAGDRDRMVAALVRVLAELDPG
ncbi:MarR family winged helix-turn-helix transcriptional regulator [Nocardiopsis trehalosi]|uniref:MarR family winged helix-turn-helix transcriptional regulator n=1 Tax=Nocardiopsis trehalosi TaxID=109329 RepID=UPI00083169A1|nr:MarR family transcriptional regulator [Nocardiopsis trehalosi]